MWSSPLRMCVVHYCISKPLSHRRQDWIESYGTTTRSCMIMIHVRRRRRRSMLLVHQRRQLLVLPPPFGSSIENGDNNDYGTSDVHNSSADHGGSNRKNEKGLRESPPSTEILKRLRRYGISGLLSYGLLNTAYYLMAFLSVWFYVAPARGRMGYLAAVERLLKIMAMVWAGSQVTKLVRAGGALALAPFVDRGLSWFTAKFKFESQAKAFMAIVRFCFGLAIMLFFIVTLLCA